MSIGYCSSQRVKVFVVISDKSVDGISGLKVYSRSSSFPMPIICEHVDGKIE